MKIPANLIFNGSKVIISFDESGLLNRTSVAIVIDGNPNGFLSLSNCLIYLTNELQDNIDLSQLPFVSSQVNLGIRLDESAAGFPVGKVERIGERDYIWTLSEEKSNGVFAAIHSLGHLNLDLHLDTEKAKSDISIYCSVTDRVA